MIIRDARQILVSWGLLLIVVTGLTACGLPTSTPTLPTATLPGTLPTETPLAAILPFHVSTSRELSPSGQWLALTVSVSPSGNDPSPGQVTQLKVIHVEEPVEWVLLDRWLPYRSGFSGWNPFYWTENERYLYFADWWAPNGCAIYLDTADWRRVELATGQVDDVALAAASFVFSPDQRSVAYRSHSESQPAIGILNLQDLTERRLTLNEGDFRSGGLVWSPDGSALVFTVIKNACRPGEELHSIERVEVETLIRTTLVPDNPRRIFTIGWPQAERVLIQDADSGPWWMDAQTGAMTPEIAP